jgi:hypothetical protein
MASSRCRWKVGDEVVERSDGLTIPAPKCIKIWQDNMKLWPPVSYPNIFNFLVLAEGCDSQAMENYKSLDSCNYFKSRKVRRIFFK